MRTELHFHLLPGVDDGPRDEHAALDLAEAAVADGTRRVVTTPHVRLVDVRELPERVARLRTLLAAARLPLEIVCGGELAPDDVSTLDDDELELIAHGPSGRRWVLLEAPLGPSRTSFDSACQHLRRRGFGVLIGHPERSPVVSNAQLHGLVASGAVLQINGSSLLERHGRGVAARAWVLAGSELPFVVASDAHSLSREPVLTESERALVRAGCDATVIRFGVETGASQLLEMGLPSATAAAA